MLVQGEKIAISAAPPLVAIAIAYVTFKAAIYDTSNPGSSSSVKASRRPVAPATITRIGSILGTFFRSSEMSVLTNAAFAAETRMAPPIVWMTVTVLVLSGNDELGNEGVFRGEQDECR
jgi:hypothetical protein